MPMQVYIIHKEREKLIYTDDKYGGAYGNYYSEVLHMIVILIEKGHVFFLIFKFKKKNVFYDK